MAQVAVAVSSFQSDVTFLGIDHHWRTLDTVLALALTFFYVAQASAGVFVSNEWSRLLSLPPLTLAVKCFVNSQQAATFPERSHYHIRWHFWMQGALLIFLAADNMYA